MLTHRQAFSRWLDRHSFASEFVAFGEVLLRAAITAFGQSELDAEAFIEGARGRFWNDLLRKIESDKQRGLRPLVEVVDADLLTLRWVPSRLRRSGSRRARVTAIRHESRPLVLRAIDLLNSRDYEALVCLVARMSGALHVQLTPAQHDGGADFFALVDQPGRCHLLRSTRGALRIVGQAKRYVRPVQVDEMKTFIATLDDVRRLQPRIEAHIPAWFRAARGPIVGWFAGHSGFERGATDMANNHGVICIDSLDLAEVVALSREFPLAPSQQHAERLREAIDRFTDMFGGNECA